MKKMKKSFKFTRLLAGAILIPAMLVSCTNAPVSSAKPASGSASMPADTAKAPLEISIIAFPQAGFTPTNDNETKKMLEEKFNVKLNVVDVDSSSLEKYNLFFAQGGKADVVISYYDETNVLVDQGIFREIKEEDLYSKMPTWMSKLETLVGDKETVKTLSKYNGKNYCIPFTHGPAVESGLMFVRKDWMDKLGITKLPETLTEFEELLRAFSQDDPDGNGKKDTYGMHGGAGWHFNYVWGAYGIMPKTYVENNGKVDYTSIMPQAKEVYKLLNKWYKAGYFDPEFVTDDRTMLRNKWSEGKLGILADNPFWMDSARGANGVLAMLEAKDANAKFEILQPFTGPEGKKGADKGFAMLTGQASIYFGKDVSDEVVYKMMEIKEAIASDWELYKRCYYGEEGKHYTTDASGKITISPTLNAEVITADGIGQTYALMPITLDWMEKTMNERDKAAHSQSLSQATVYSGIAFAATRANQPLAIKGEDVNKIVSEYYINAVTGKVDIDATWDDYVKNVRKAGLDDILADYEAMLSGK